MPRWDLHLFSGLSAVGILATGAIMPFVDSFSISPNKGLYLFTMALVMGSFSLLLGSLLPDIDGRGRVRWIIGPALGLMALLPVLLLVSFFNGPMDPIAYLGGKGAVTFLVVTAGGYAALIVPMRHRGIMHKKTTAIWYGAAIAVYCFLVWGPSIEYPALTGAMGSIGYAWHLALDGAL